MNFNHSLVLWALDHLVDVVHVCNNRGGIGDLLIAIPGGARFIMVVPYAAHNNTYFALSVSLCSASELAHYDN